jgi:hypothetical protein
LRKPLRRSPLLERMPFSDLDASIPMLNEPWNRAVLKNE